MPAPDAFILVNAADRDAPAQGGIRIRDESVQRYGPLAHAQFRFWFWHECCAPGRKWLLNLVQTWDVAGGQGVTAAEDALRRLLARHEALRTTYGLDQAHEPVQRVHPLPRLALAEAGLGPAAAAGEAVARLHQLLAERDFALDTEFPFRAGIVADGETVTVIAVFHHSIADGHAVLMMHDEFRALTEGRSLRAEEELWHPVDQAREERSVAGRRRDDAALAWLSGVYQKIPPGPVISPPPGAENRLPARQPLYRQLWIDSARALRDVRSAARILRVTPYFILVSAYTIVLALASGDSCVAILSGYSNRHLKNAKHAVICLVQDVPICHRIEPAMKFSEILSAMRLTCFKAFYSGNYSLGRLAGLRVAMEDERGVCLARESSLNYIELDLQEPRQGAGDAQGEPPPSALDGISRWEEFKDPSVYSHDMNLVIHKEATFLRFGFNICTDVVSPASAEAIIRALQDCLAAIAAGQDPSVRELGEMLNMPAPARPVTRPELAGCVVDLAAVRSLLLQHPDVIEAAVFAPSPALDAVDASARVCAYAHAVSPLPIAELRHFVMTRLGDYRLAAVPHTFVITRSSPADPGNEKDWRRQPVAARGTGREQAGPAAGRHDPGIVGDVAARLGALRGADPGLGYLQQGGRLVMVPAIVRQLRKEGYGGLSPADFLGHWTISELSARAAEREESRHV
jgi:hypothetical protein